MVGKRQIVFVTLKRESRKARSLGIRGPCQISILGKIETDTEARGMLEFSSRCVGETRNRPPRRPGAVESETRDEQIRQGEQPTATLRWSQDPYVYTGLFYNVSLRFRKH